jgi:hypothetical protein
LQRSKKCEYIVREKVIYECEKVIYELKKNCYKLYFSRSHIKQPFGSDPTNNVKLLCGNRMVPEERNVLTSSFNYVKRMPKKHADTIFKALGRHPISDNKKDEDESEDDSLDYDYNDEEDHDSDDVGEDHDSEKSEDSSDEDSTGELSESDEEPIPEEFI